MGAIAMGDARKCLANGGKCKCNKLKGGFEAIEQFLAMVKTLG
ncbi:hypothetical protein [Helicobacter sp.]|nr:hypothetical protein [Helicobacter sp.]MDY2585633.1 hypothetical protein [Helicobacter sp.]